MKALEDYKGRFHKNDPLQQYLREIGQISLLTQNEELDLARRMHAGDHEAKNRLIEANLRLVVCIARRYLNRGLAIADLIEEGNLGLMHAVKKFNPEAGVRFSTYSTWWIRQAIERGIMNQSRNIRLPIHLIKKYKQYLRLKQTNEHRDIYDTPIKAIAKSLGLSEAALYDLIAIERQELSIDATLSEDQDVTLQDSLFDEKNIDPVEIINSEELHKLIESHLKQLPQREREVLEKRYGLHNNNEETLDRIGQLASLTRERVRQIQLRALKALKNSFRRNGFGKSLLKK